MRHFYLRNATGFPVCCVATELGNQFESNLEVKYATSTYNLADLKPQLKDGKIIPALPYKRHRARTAARGRLSSPSHFRTLIIASTTIPRNVKVAICHDIAANSTSQLARDAAKLWLSAIETQNNADWDAKAAEVMAEAKADGRCPHNLEYHDCIECTPDDEPIVSRRDDLGDLQSPGEAERVPELTVDDGPADDEDVGRPMTIAEARGHDTPSGILDVLHDREEAREEELVIDVTSDDLAKIDRLFDADCQFNSAVAETIHTREDQVKLDRIFHYEGSH